MHKIAKKMNIVLYELKRSARPNKSSYFETTNNCLFLSVLKSKNLKKKNF